MDESRSPLKRSIFSGTVLFIVLLCVVLSFVEYNSSMRMVYDQYEAFVGTILDFVAADIDVDDLGECIRTGVKSPKYQELQKALDMAKERLPIHFIYIIIPLNAGDYDNVQNVIAGATQYEYENEAESIVELNSLTGDSYSRGTASKYLKAYQTGKMSFFVEKSAWGVDYTGLLPLYDSKGERVAALCVDIDIADIYATLRRKVYEVVLLILLIGIVSIIIFYYWTERKVTGPIKTLEAGVANFVAKYRQGQPPESLVLDVSSIRTRNEVETLANAVSEMGKTIREYAESAAITENALRQIEEKLIDLEADLDALTRRYSGDAAETIAPEQRDGDIHELEEQVSELRGSIREYYRHTGAQRGFKA